MEDSRIDRDVFAFEKSHRGYRIKEILQELWDELEFRLEPDVDARANAAFGQATVSLTRRVAVTAGLRYTHERKTIDNAGGLYTADAPVTLLSDAYSYTNVISHDAWTPKFGVEVRGRKDVLAYASVTRGFKSGGFNATSTAAGRGYDPEWAGAMRVD